MLEVNATAREDIDEGSDEVGAASPLVDWEVLLEGLLLDSLFQRCKTSAQYCIRFLFVTQLCL